MSEKENRAPYEIPAAGSLGLFALGAVGIKGWREKRDKVKEKKKEDLRNKSK